MLTCSCWFVIISIALIINKSHEVVVSYLSFVLFFLFVAEDVSGEVLLLFQVCLGKYSYFRFSASPFKLSALVFKSSSSSSSTSSSPTSSSSASSSSASSLSHLHCYRHFRSFVPRYERIFVLISNIQIVRTEFCLALFDTFNNTGKTLVLLRTFVFFIFS